MYLGICLCDGKILHAALASNSRLFSKSWLVLMPRSGMQGRLRPGNKGFGWAKPTILPNRGL